jgi:hypothetical protein
MADLEARADVVAHGWLVLAAVRYAPLGTRVGADAVPGYAYDEIALSVGFGRRVPLGNAALDITLAAEAVIMTEEGDVPADGVGGTDAQVRVDGAARLVVPLGSRWRPSVTLDTEFAPPAPIHVDARLPPLPTWTMGLRAGAVGDLL